MSGNPIKVLYITAGTPGEQEGNMESKVMMNRGKLENWEVRLYMIYGRLRIPKSEKIRKFRSAKVGASKMSKQALINHIEIYLSKLEVM